MHIIRHQILQDLSRTVGETVNFVVPEPDGMNYIDRVETDWAFRIQLPVGSRVPFHCTASGKCFLASLQRKKREALVATLNLSEETPYSHTKPETLLAELNQVAKQGYALDREEFLLHMVAISVPVRNPIGGFVGAVSFHGPTQRMSIDSATEQLPKLQATSAKLSNALFAESDNENGM
ncbi:MAG: IclR family transcriptional regulator [Pseudomonadota bacterium]